MDALIKLLIDIINGKNIVPFLFRIFSLLFAINISISVLKIFYGSFDFSKLITTEFLIRFFGSGDFFIPTLIITIVFTLTHYIPTSILWGIGYFIGLRHKKYLAIKPIKQEVFEEGVIKIANVSNFISPVRISKKTILEFISIFRKNISDEIIEEFTNDTSTAKKSTLSFFVFFFRLLVFITLYFLSQSPFSYLLYFTLLILILIVMSFLIILYYIFEILPAILYRFKTDVDKYSI